VKRSVSYLSTLALKRTHIQHSLSVQPHDDSTERLSTLLYIKVDLVGDDRSFGSISVLSKREDGQDENRQKADEGFHGERAHDCVWYVLRNKPELQPTSIYDYSLDEVLDI